MNGYDLSRSWFDFCFENPEKIKPNHSAVYFFAIEHCNRLGWKKKFGFPSAMVMEAVGIKSYNTYIKTLNELVEYGFIKMIQRSKNQYSSNIIALSNFNKALDKALDKALIKHTTKQIVKQRESIDSINKQETINNKQETSIDYKKSLLSELKNSDFEYPEYFEITIAFYELFKKNLLDAGGSTTTLEKAKGVWVDSIRLLIEADRQSLDSVRTVFVYLQRNEFWKKNILSTKKLRDQFNKLLMNANGKTKQNHREPATTDQELINIVQKHFGKE